MKVDFHFSCQICDIISNFFRKDQYNWLDFSLIHISCEQSFYCRYFEYSFALLGFWLTITIYSNEKMKELEEKFEE